MNVIVNINMLSYISYLGIELIDFNFDYMLSGWVSRFI